MRIFRLRIIAVSEIMFFIAAIVCNIVAGIYICTKNIHIISDYIDIDEK